MKRKHNFIVGDEISYTVYDFSMISVYDIRYIVYYEMGQKVFEAIFLMTLYYIGHI